MRFRLVPLEGGNSIELTRDLTVVGRKEDCDLRLDHKSVSKFHCVIVKMENTLLLRDLGSTNGTLVNGKKIRRATLKNNDCLNIANLPFRIQINTGEPIDKKPHLEGTIQINNQEEDVDENHDDKSDSCKIKSDEIVQNNDLPDNYPTNN
ncbi:MAG: FHA domain-containing protein [Planctomycetes bacterium]|nr:FHA domain-containing protein [Planctomycetota bacterium]NBY03731.1 FHA domain-containing protein [Planctomycetota bacterium]